MSHVKTFNVEWIDIYIYIYIYIYTYSVFSNKTGKCYVERY